MHYCGRIPEHLFGNAKYLFGSGFILLFFRFLQFSFFIEYPCRFQAVNPIHSYEMIFITNSANTIQSPSINFTTPNSMSFAFSCSCFSVSSPFLLPSFLVFIISSLLKCCRLKLLVLNPRTAILFLFSTLFATFHLWYPTYHAIWNSYYPKFGIFQIRFSPSTPGSICFFYRQTIFSSVPMQLHQGLFSAHAPSFSFPLGKFPEYFINPCRFHCF